jgi:hypothetical protein
MRLPAAPIADTASETPLAAAIAMVAGALELIDAHDFGTFAAPHLDLGLVKLQAEQQAALLALQAVPTK